MNPIETHPPKVSLGLIPLLLLALAAGCESKTPTIPRNLRNQALAETDNFTIATDYLANFADHEADYGQRNMLYRLNTWIKEQEPPADWEVDRLARQLPKAYQATEFTQQYDRRSFDTDDGWSLWEAAMMKRVGTWVLRNPIKDPLLEDWYAAIESKQGADHVHRLRTAAQLFDWTVRNIQLDPLLEYIPAGQPGPVQAGTVESSLPAPMRGIPGPGYRFTPWQVLLYGRGDAWQRARVFIRLARQQQLDVVMLAIDDPAREPLPRPWLPALLLDGELYLFDAALGLPLPGAGGKGIARLSDLVTEPEIIRQCDVKEHPYQVESKDLDGLEVLIDASPAELSQRMSVVEANLTGARKLKLTVSPSDLASRIREIKGVSNIRVWPIAVETRLYAELADETIALNRSLQLDYIVREFIFTSVNPVSLARWQHLAGNFESSPEKRGAKQLYLEARNSEGTIGQMAQSPVIQRKLGLKDGLSENPQQRAAQLQSIEAMLRQSAHNASYWLGLINYDEGKPSVALTWFQRQTLEGQSTTVWETGAAYNVGRSLEQMGDYEKALVTYLTQDESPSRPGQLLRAKLLEARFAK